MVASHLIVCCIEKKEESLNEVRRRIPRLPIFFLKLCVQIPGREFCEEALVYILDIGVVTLCAYLVL